MFARRPADGIIHPDKFQARAHFADLYIDDGTGLVLTTPTALTDIAGALVLQNQADGIVVDVTLDTFTVQRSGIYEAGFTHGEIVGVNTQAIVATVVVDGAEPTPAGAGAKITAKLTQPATALAIVSLAASGFLNLKKGQVVKFQASASTGNLTLRRSHMWLRQVTDAAEQP